MSIPYSIGQLTLRAKSGLDPFFSLLSGEAILKIDQNGFPLVLRLSLPLKYRTTGTAE